MGNSYLRLYSNHRIQVNEHIHDSLCGFHHISFHFRNLVHPISPSHQSKSGSLCSADKFKNSKRGGSVFSLNASDEVCKVYKGRSSIHHELHSHFHSRVPKRTDPKASLIIPLLPERILFFRQFCHIWCKALNTKVVNSFPAEVFHTNSHDSNAGGERSKHSLLISPNELSLVVQ